MGRTSPQKQDIVHCILVDKKGKITLWSQKDEQFDKEIYNNSGVLKQNISGFIRYIIFSDHVELKQIFVRPEMRKEGYGRLLVERLIKLAIKNKKKKIIAISGTTRGEVFGDFLERMRFTHGTNKNWTREIWEI